MVDYITVAVTLLLGIVGESDEVSQVIHRK